MPVFVELVTDSFKDVFDNQRADRASSGTGRSTRAGTARARRPMRGLEIKEDTYAFLKVVRADGTPLELFDSGSETGKSTQYTNFLLQSVQEARMEKHQIVDTFGEAYIFFFGEQPRFLDVTAVLINSHDFNWEAEFWANYDTYLRGTKLVEMGARTYLFYDDNVVEGYWLSAQAVKTSDQPLSVQLSFRLFLTNVSNVSLVGDPHFPIRSSLFLPADVDLTKADGFTLARSTNEAVATAAAEEARTLTDALRGGLGQGSGSDLTGLLQNANEAVGDLNAKALRSTPVRSLIQDNFDEFTHLPAPPPDPQRDDQDGEMTSVDSLPDTVLDELHAHGAKADQPTLLEKLGLAPHTWSESGPGRNAGGISFGPGPPPTGVGPTGAPPGFGFNGQSFGSAGASFVAGVTAVAGASFVGSVQAGVRGVASVAGRSSFVGGVQVGGGLFGGVGVGGGVSGGLRGNSFGQLTGAASFRAEAGPAASFGGPGMGASSVVGGRPSAFAFLVVDGSLNEAGDSDGFLSVSGSATGPGFSKSFKKTWVLEPDPPDEGRVIG